MIDTTREELIGVEEAARVMKVTVKCIYGWMCRSARKLESVKFGGKRMTSREAIQRFGQQGGSASSGVVLSAGHGPINDAAAVAELEKL